MAFANASRVKKPQNISMLIVLKRYVNSFWVLKFLQINVAEMMVYLIEIIILPKHGHNEHLNNQGAALVEFVWVFHYKYINSADKYLFHPYRNSFPSVERMSKVKKKLQRLLIPSPQFNL